jgi:hypothetical protein
VSRRIDAHFGKREISCGDKWVRSDIPANEHGTRTLCLVEPQQEVGKADDGAGALATAPNDRLRNAVICAMRE